MQDLDATKYKALMKTDLNKQIYHVHELEHSKVSSPLICTVDAKQP